MNLLPWISDDDLTQATQTLFSGAQKAHKYISKRRKQNTIDPFYSLVIASTWGIKSHSDLVSMENTASAMRGVSNALGTFHQDVLGSVSGWKNHDKVYDLLNESRKILVELKNKHNTMNSKNTEKVISSLWEAVNEKDGGVEWQGYLVRIIPKKPERYKKKVNSNQNVFDMDGASFYEEATGHPNALHDLFDVLCDKIFPTIQRVVSQDIKDYCAGIFKESLPSRK